MLTVDSTIQWSLVGKYGGRMNADKVKRGEATVLMLDHGYLAWAGPWWQSDLWLVRTLRKQAPETRNTPRDSGKGKVVERRGDGGESEGQGGGEGVVKRRQRKEKEGNTNTACIQNL
jgi:hypothetical protein